MPDKLDDVGSQEIMSPRAFLPEWLRSCEFDQGSAPIQEISPQVAELLSWRQLSGYLFQDEEGKMLISGEGLSKYRGTITQIANVFDRNISQKMFFVNSIDKFILSKAVQPTDSLLGDYPRPTCLTAAFFRVSKLPALQGCNIASTAVPGKEVIKLCGGVDILKLIPSYIIGLDSEPCYIAADFCEALRRVSTDPLKFERLLRTKTKLDLPPSFHWSAQ